MQTFRDKIEGQFQATGLWLYRNPWKTLVATLALVLFLALQIPSITIDTSSEALLRKNDPSLLRYNAFRDQFGRAELIVIAVNAPEIFDAGFLARLKAFHADLENEVPYVREVTSLINVRQTRGSRNELMVQDLLAGWPEKAVDLDALRTTVMQTPFYSDYVISRDGRVAAVIIETEASVADTEAGEDPLAGFEDEVPAPAQDRAAKRYFSERENREVVETVNRLAARHEHSDFRLHVAGGPVIVYAFNRATLEDVERCIVLTLLAVALFLGILFRRVSGILLPVSVIITTLVSTMGAMALLNTPIKITTTIIPAFLLSVGVCDSVHVLAIFYRELDRGNAKDAAIAHAMGHSGLAIVMTSLTTMAGLLSFLAADLTAIAEIGAYAAVGVLLALVYTIGLLPVFIALFPLKPASPCKAPRMSMERVLTGIADFSTAHTLKILAGGALLLIIFLPGVFKLKFSHNIVQYFPPDHPYRQSLEHVDRHLNGTITLEVVVDTRHENGLYEPGLLNRIEAFSGQLEAYRHPQIHVGKVFAITDILKETHKALNENAPDAFRVPRQRDVVAQEFLLFENSGSDDLERIVDSQFSKTRLTIKTPWVDAMVSRDFIQVVEDRLRATFGDTAAFHSTGLMALLARAISAAIYSMAKSYGIALFAITLMMVAMLGSLKTGLISMLPNLLPIIMAMGLMGWMDIPLDLNSLMIGSIAMGVVVDDTVHFMYNFQKYYDRQKDAGDAVRQTLVGTGRALLITSLVLCTGFFILMTASLNHLVRFGLFTGITILLALAADFLLAPALMTVVKGRGQRPGTTIATEGRTPELQNYRKTECQRTGDLYSRE